MVKSFRFGGIRASNIAAVARALCKTGTSDERSYVLPYRVFLTSHCSNEMHLSPCHTIESDKWFSTADALDIEASKSRCKLSDHMLFQWQCSQQLVTVLMNIQTFVLFIRKTPFVICILLLYIIVMVILDVRLDTR